MHGLAAMLGAGKLAAQPGPQAELMRRPIGVTPSEAEAEQALRTLVARMSLAERRVEMALHSLTQFEAQAAALPESHVARQVCDKLVTEMRGALNTGPAT